MGVIGKNRRGGEVGPTCTSASTRKVHLQHQVPLYLEVQAVLEVWNVEIHRKMKVVKERHVTGEGSESSHLAFHRVDHLWPSWLFVSSF